MEYEVGKYYWVPCIRQGAGKTWRPVFPPLHEDAKFFNFPTLHYHLDPRFLSAREYAAFSYLKVATGYPEECLGPVSYRLKKCQRPMPQYPSFIRWRYSFSSAYAKKRLINGICPHRGIDLTTCPVVDGIVTCPGHGLRWNIETGRLVRNTWREGTTHEWTP